MTDDETHTQADIAKLNAETAWLEAQTKNSNARQLYELSLLQSETRWNNKRASWHGWIGSIGVIIALIALFKEPLIKLIQG